MAYRFEKLKLNDRVLSPTSPINKCYLITMHNSKRRSQYLQQLEKVPLMNEIDILVNSGYKTGLKPDWVTSSIYDIFHANLQIFYMEKNNPGYVIVLEDDVEFSPDFKQHIGEIEKFIHKKRPDIYYFGTTCILTIPSIGKHKKIKISGATHCIALSQETRNKILSEEFVKKFINQKVFTHDIYVSLKFKKQYTYHKPIAAQKHVMTENMKEWDYKGIVEKATLLMKTDKDAFFLYRTLHISSMFGGIGTVIFIAFILVLCIILKIFHKKK